MNHNEIVSRLSENTNSTGIIHTITTQDILIAISRRMGSEALTLSAEDLELAIEEVKEVINHNLDIREYIEMGLDAWEITHSL